jgi:hypothetical protein
MSKLIITSMIAKGRSVKFDAYLTDMSQTFDPTWNSTNVFGRNDPIATFQRTQRTISLALEVPSADLLDAKENLEKCGDLATFMYPGYNIKKQRQDKVTSKSQAAVDPIETGKYMSRPPLVKIKFANIINGPGGGLLGFISSYSFNPVLEAGMFKERPTNDEGDFLGSAKYYPRTISISLGFTVLHQTELGFEVDSSGGTKRLGKIPFI